MKSRFRNSYGIVVQIFLLILIANTGLITGCRPIIVGSPEITSSPVLPDTWRGIKLAGAPGVGAGTNAAATAPDGSLIIAGQTDGSLDDIPLTGTGDCFLIQFNSVGKKQWTQLLGSAGTSSNILGVTTDSIGNIFVTGETYGALEGNVLTGTTDSFIAKYSNAGALQWIKQFGVAGVDTNAKSIALDPDGNIFIVGQTAGALPGNALAGTVDFFIAKFDSAGVNQWFKQMGNAGGDAAGYSVKSDQSGNIYAVGDTRVQLGGTPLTGIRDIFIAKYNGSGDNQWLKMIGFAGLESYGYAVTTDPTGNILVSGQIPGSLDSNPLLGNTDALVAKYNPAGDRLWSKQAGGIAGDTPATSVACDSEGNVFITGSAPPAGLHGNISVGSPDLYIIKYNSSGVRQWTKQFGAFDSGGMANNISVDSNNNIFVSGYVVGTERFSGNAPIGNMDSFIAKFDSSGNLQ